MLARVADEIWSYEKDLRLPGGMYLPSRSTIVRLASGALVLHSPLAIDDAEARDIDALGEVRFLIAPNYVHWMFLRAAAERYPRAKVLGVPGLEKKLGPLRFEPLPADGPIEGLGDELLGHRIAGVPFMMEHAFFHARSRSLVVTDLFFNVRRCESLMMRVFLRFTGTYGKTAQSRVWRFLVRDRRAAGASVSTLLGWDFERVLPAHGEVLQEDPRGEMARALAWMTRGASSVPLLRSPEGQG